MKNLLMIMALLISIGGYASEKGSEREESSCVQARRAYSKQLNKTVEASKELQRLVGDGDQNSYNNHDIYYLELEVISLQKMTHELNLKQKEICSLEREFQE